VVLTKKIRVRDGFNEIGSIAGQRGFVSWERVPGDVLVSAGDSGYVSLTAKKGETYYILARDVDPMVVRLELVDEEKGREALAKATPPDMIEGPRIRTSGTSGPVEWRATEIAPSPQYSFALILTEMRGTSIMFTSIEQTIVTSLESRGLLVPNDTSTARSRQEGTWQLPAGGQLRLPFAFVLVCRQCRSWTPAWNIVLTGKDEAGQDVRVVADVMLPPVAN